MTCQRHRRGKGTDDKRDLPNNKLETELQTLGLLRFWTLENLHIALWDKKRKFLMSMV